MSAQNQTVLQFSGIRLARDNHFDRPHPAAQHVIDTLAAEKLPALSNMEAVRKHHERSRGRFLAPLEEVHSVFHISKAPHVPRLTIIRPRLYEQIKSLPALVYLHGGGWTLGSFATYEPFCRQLANATGSILIWVDYRLAPEHPFPAAFDDTRAALRWIRANALRFGIDETRIMLGGDSAGGNLAAAISIAERDEQTIHQPWRQVLLYPCLDLTASLPSHKKFAHGYLLTAFLYAMYRKNYLASCDPADWRVSPLFANSVEKLPPTVLLYAGFDPLRDDAAAFAMKLTLAGVDIQSLYFPDMIHGFLTMGGTIPQAEVAVTRIAQALRALNGVSLEASEA